MTTAASTNRRIALKVQYLGANFFGWQRQPHHRSVQGELEAAIAELVGHQVLVQGAGRTDTGVHAAGQVAHFDTTSPIPGDRWGYVLNNVLPDDVSIAASAQVDPSWHSRFSALWRRYRYAIWNTSQPSIFVSQYSWHLRLPLDHMRMASALESLRGEHDFDVFRLAGSNRAHSRVTVEHVSCSRSGPMVWVDVQASGFLYRMMRLLIGALASVGKGELSPIEFECMWRDRHIPPIRYSAPACGLCLTGVGYPTDPFGSQFHADPPIAHGEFPPLGPLPTSEWRPLSMETSRLDGQLISAIQ